MPNAKNVKIFQVFLCMFWSTVFSKYYFIKKLIKSYVSNTFKEQRIKLKKIVYSAFSCLTNYVYFCDAW